MAAARAWESEGGMEDDSMRRCAVTGRVLPRERLIRFALAPDGRVVPDLLEVLPGRGIWVGAERSVLRSATERDFARSAKGKVYMPEGLADTVEAGLVVRCVELLGLARRAGAAVCGFEKVRAALRTGKVRLLMAACDGAADGRGKVRVLAPDAPFADALSAAELGAAFGRDRAVHAAMTDKALAARAARDCSRLAGIRTDMDNGKVDLA